MKKKILLLCLISFSSHAMLQSLLEKNKNMLSRLEILYQKYPLAFFDLEYCVENPDEVLHPIFQTYYQWFGFLNDQKELKPEVCDLIKNNVDLNNGIEVKFITAAATE